jgi:mRNA interferase HigB
MRVIALSRLRECWMRLGHRGLEDLLRAWFREVEKADWSSPADLRARYASASFLSDNRVCFNVGGNKYRIIALVFYERKLVYVRFAGSHEEYDRIDADTV